MPQPIPHNAHLNRQNRLSENLANYGLDAVALNAGPSLTYLTGLHFHLSERPIVAIFMPGNPLTLVLPELEIPKLKSLAYPIRQFPYSEDPGAWSDVFRRAMEEIGIEGKVIGVEERRFRVLELRLMEAATDSSTFKSAEALLASIRMHKDDVEISAMRKAVDVAQLALHAALPEVKPGRTEKQVAAELTMQLYRHGSDPELPFSPIVASGPNSANPHATPTVRQLAQGDLLLLDWGACVDGYFSDLTRTFAIGDVDEELVEIARIVERANTAARQIASPGVSAGEVDRAARSVIERAGYGEYFTHRTGHGLGLESHEEPYLFDGNQLQLALGMAFTIEPGIYLPEKGGVRIEDDVVITASGCESLSNLPRQLIAIT